MEEVRIEAGGLVLGGLAMGPTGGPTVLALHGWLDNAASFLPMAPYLAAARPEVRVIALDLAGHGASGWRGEGAQHSFVDWVPEVIAAADALGLERFGLLGHSMGAGIAALVAAAAPERVGSLALIEGLAPHTDAPEDAPGQLRRAVAQRRRAPGVAPVFATLEEAVARRLQGGSWMEAESARLLTARQVEAVEGGVRFRSDPRLRRTSLLRLSEAQALAFLGAVEAPTLLVAAERGWAFDPAAMAARVAAVRRLEVRRLPGGHHLHMDDPGAVATEVVRFWREHL